MAEMLQLLKIIFITWRRPRNILFASWGHMTNPVCQFCLWRWQEAGSTPNKHIYCCFLEINANLVSLICLSLFVYQKQMKSLLNIFECTHFITHFSDYEILVRFTASTFSDLWRKSSFSCFKLWTFRCLWNGWCTAEARKFLRHLV